MIEYEGYKLKNIQRKHYPFILSWYRSNATVAGFENPFLELYDLETIKNIYDNPSDNMLSFIIQKTNGIPVGIILINIEWENRNGILSIIIGPGRGQNFGIGFNMLMGAISYCKDELNLRRLEVKVSDKNRVMMKLCRVFPKDESLIIDIFYGKDDWDDKIKKYFSITQEEYEKNWENYATKYIKNIVFSSPSSELILKDDTYNKGDYANFHINSIILPKTSESLKDLLLLSSGNFKKSEIYYKIPERFKN